MKELIHKKLVEKKEKIDEWWRQKLVDLEFPIYTSVDIRDAGHKIASVDANIFPAGFNNICDVDLDAAPKLLRSYLRAHYKKENLKVLLLTEEHTSELQSP